MSKLQKLLAPFDLNNLSWPERYLCNRALNNAYTTHTISNINDKEINNSIINFGYFSNLFISIFILIFSMIHVVFNPFRLLINGSVLIICALLGMRPVSLMYFYVHEKFKSKKMN